MCRIELVFYDATYIGKYQECRWCFIGEVHAKYQPNSNSYGHGHFAYFFQCGWIFAEANLDYGVRIETTPRLSINHTIRESNDLIWHEQLIP